jgi:hypothetical protein
VLARCSITFALLSSLVPALVGQTPRGTLVLKNTRWERVQFEVRVGPSTNCDANAQVRLRTLRHGQGWAFLSAGVICWRREQVPGDPALGWTAWEQVRVPAGARQEVAL